jgi:peptidoglycan hydrolase CwlO-like protein
MPIAHAVTPSALRAELEDAEAKAASLQAEVSRTQQETAKIQRAGTTVLAALEAAMVPLMAELALTRQACKEYCEEQGEAFILDPSLSSQADAGMDVSSAGKTAATVQDEIDHLRTDISHFQHKADKLQVEERQRSHEISRLCGEITEAYEHLDYERKCVQHHTVCQEFGMDPSGGSGWAGMGPCGIGRRTLEVRAEQKLREHAEMRGGRLARDVTKLSSDTSQQQACIAELAARLKRAKRAHAERDRRLLHNQKQTQLLETKLKVTSSESYLPREGGEAADFASTTGGIDGFRPRHGKKKGLAASTGKLPQLSF